MAEKPTIDGLDTSAARERILSRVRAAQGRPEQAKAREEELNFNYVSQKVVGPQPDLGDDLLGRFIAQSERLQSTVARVGALSDVPAAVADYLRDRGLGTRAIVWKSFAGLDWSAAGLQVEARAPVRDDPVPDLVGVTGCFAAVAETGTLALLSGPDTPASMALLPETHIAVVPCLRIVRHMEDVFALLRHERGEPPRALNFISGPSRTGDIEQTIVLGAHGPYRVHLILVERM
jgi:L-lactate dehydrogenase complex protein LldG